MTCGLTDCSDPAFGELTYNGKTRWFCEAHYELAKMAMTILEVREATGTNPDFDTVNTAMERGR